MTGVTANSRYALRAIAAAMATYAVARLLRHAALDVGFESLYYPLAAMATLASLFWRWPGLLGCMGGLWLALGMPLHSALPHTGPAQAHPVIAASVAALLTGIQGLVAARTLRRIASLVVLERLSVSVALAAVVSGGAVLGSLHPLASMLLYPMQIHVLPFHSLPALWGAWISDTLALWMVAPVILLWELRRLDNDGWRGPQRTAGAIVVAGALASGLVSLFVYQQQATLAKVRYSAQAMTLRDELQSEVVATLHKMEAVAAYLLVHPQPDVADYDRFADQIMKESPVLLGLGIALPVKHADRAATEARLTREYGRPIQFLDYLDGGDTQVSVPREDYWPVTRLVPKRRQGVIGFDEAFEPKRKQGVMDALNDGVGASPLIRTIKRDRAHQSAFFLFKRIDQPYPAIILSPIQIDALLDNCPMARPIQGEGYGIELRGSDGSPLLSRNMPSGAARSSTHVFNQAYSRRLGERSRWQLHVVTPLAALPFLHEPLWWIGQAAPQLLFALIGTFLFVFTLRSRKLLQLQRQFAAYAPPSTQALHPRDADKRADDLIQSGWAGRAFVPWYQPVVDMRSGRACGAEALLRWEQMPDGVNPMDIVRWAERHRLIRELDRHIRSTAFAQMTSHGFSNVERFSLAVNVSALELREPDFAERLLADLSRGGLPGWRLSIEITESEWLRWDDAAISQLTVLRASGVGIALDDFGAGYSSIAYLRQLPVDRIKLDRSLVAGMTSDAKAQQIVASIVGLGQSLGVEIVAEGVEDKQTMDALLKIGCHLAQGYYFAPAVPIARLLDWVR